MDELVTLSRKENEEALVELEKSGIEMIEINDQSELEKINQIGIQARENMTKNLFSKELLDKVEKSLEEFRNENNK